MGQKINPTIFRLGVNKTWKTEFFEKKNHELPLYVFKDLEIRNYIERVFETYGIILHDYKQHYNGSTLNLYVSYFITSDFVLNRKQTNEELTVTNAGKGKKITKELSKPFNHFRLQEKVNITGGNSARPYKLRHYLNSISQDESFFDNFLKQSKPPIASKKDRVAELNYTKFETDSIFGQVFEILNLFNDNNTNIVLNFCCINKDLYSLKLTQEKIFMSLQKFRNTPFLKEGVELLLYVVYNSNSANLLAKFIAFQLKKIKRHKFFLSFLKQSLTILSSSASSKIKGVKIVIKGRLNGVPRAKQKIIIVGDVPVQSISAKLDYFQTTIHNSNGSYGIKVWVVEK